MSLQHLASGDPFPPLENGRVRIYAMRFCPYAQRVLLVATAKNIQSDVVFINLQHKPDWMYPKSPGGKVPALERHDGKTLCESLVISDYLDKAYPAPGSEAALISPDPFREAEDRMLVENFSKLGSLFYKMVFVLETPADDIPKLAEEYEGIVKQCDAELALRGTKFFAGDKPGMIDFMLWPWFERRPVLQYQHETVDFSALQNSPNIEKWITEMMEIPAVQMWFIQPELHHKYNQTVRAGDPDFNMLLRNTSFQFGFDPCMYVNYIR